MAEIVSLSSLPTDCTLLILTHLDGPSVAAFAELTNKRHSTQLAPYLGELWKRLHSTQCRLAPASTAEPEQPPEPPAFLKPRRAALASLSAGEENRRRGARLLEHYFLPKADICAWKSAYVRTRVAQQKRSSSVRSAQMLCGHAQSNTLACWLVKPSAVLIDETSCV